MAFSSHLKLNLEDVEPCVSGPKRYMNLLLYKLVTHACTLVLMYVVLFSCV